MLRAEQRSIARWVLLVCCKMCGRDAMWCRKMRFTTVAWSREFLSPSSAMLGTLKDYIRRYIVQVGFT